MNIFVYRTRIEAPAEEVFRWHSRPGAFERLTPPWEKVKVVERSDGIRDSPRVVLTTFLGLLPQQWVLEHRGYEEGRQFHDVQISGPFSHWEHTHTVEPEDPSSCYLEDRIEYILPMGLLGSILGTSFVNSKLKKIFSYRHRTLKRDVALHNKYAGDKPMQILVPGST